MKIFYSFIVLLGASFEYYIYMLFAFSLPFLTSVFVGTDAIKAGYLILFLSSIFRPLGGFLIGGLGDKYSREYAIFFAMMMMSFSTILLVILPSYAKIGIYSTILLITIRIIQVASVAGEHTGSAIFLIEQMQGTNKVKRDGLASGISYFFTMLGTLMATVGNYYSNIENFRYAFLIGALLFFIAILIKLLPNEGVKIKKIQEEVEPDAFWKNFFACFLMSAGMSGMFYYNIIFLTNFFESIIDPILVKQYKVYYLLIYLFSVLIAGFISDYLKKFYLMLYMPLLLALLALPTILFQSLLFHIINIVVLALYVGPSHASLYKIFSKKHKYKSVSAAYSLGTAFIGSFTPYVCKYIQDNLHTVFSSFWLIFLCLLSIVGCLLQKKRLMQD